MTPASVAAFCAPAPLHRVPASRAISRHRPPTAPRAALAAPSPNLGPDRAAAAAASSVPLDTLLSKPFTTLSPALSFRVTLLSPHAAALRERVSQLVRARGATLSEWRALSATALDAQLRCAPATDVERLRRQLFELGRAHAADVVLQAESVASEAKRLAVFDLDSTLIAQETIDELAAEMNVQSHCKSITHRAMNGEIAFRDALSQRVMLLKGLSTSALEDVKSRVKFTPGAFEMVHVLKSMGCRTAVVSGGFHFLADHVRDALGLDFAFANRLEVDARSASLTGRTLGEIVDAQYKSDTLRMLAQRFGLRSEQTLAVGDGSNDLLMMHSAGLGVAFNAKPAVQDRAKYRVNQSSLSDVLYLLGLSQQRIQTLVGSLQKRT